MSNGSRRAMVTRGCLVVTIVAAVAGCGGLQASHSPTPSLSSSAPGQDTVVEPVELGPPIGVQIPAIGVDAEVEPLGTAADGSQDVPKSLATVGWWMNGSGPGQDGNAVFVGHTSSGAADGVFDRLGQLRSGDRVVVSTKAGAVTFAVRSQHLIRNDEFAEHAAQIYRTRGVPGLVLMTCSTWNGEDYETTTVVLAHRAPD